MPFYSMSLGDIAYHNCPHPEEYTPGLVYERWTCPECNSDWSSDRRGTGNPNWKRLTRSSRKWRKKKRKQIQENLGRP